MALSGAAQIFDIARVAEQGNTCLADLVIDSSLDTDAVLELAAQDFKLLAGDYIVVFAFEDCSLIVGMHHLDDQGIVTDYKYDGTVPETPILTTWPPRSRK